MQYILSKTCLFEDGFEILLKVMLNTIYSLDERETQTKKKKIYTVSGVSNSSSVSVSVLFPFRSSFKEFTYSKPCTDKIK